MSDQVPPSQDPYGQAPQYGSPGQAVPPGYGQVPQYGQPGQYGYGVAPSTPPQTSGKAIAVMVLGIVGIALICGYGIGVIPAIVALALAPGAKREIRDSGGRLVGEGQIKAGVICSWVAVGLTVAAIAVVLVVVLVAAASSSSSGY